MLSLLSLLLSPLRSSLPRRYSGWRHRRIVVTALLEARTIYRGSHYCSHLNFKHTVIIRRIVTISLFGLDAMHDAICPIAPLPSWSSLHYLYEPLYNAFTLSSAKAIFQLFQTARRGKGHAVVISDFSGVLWSSFVISDFYSDLSRYWFDADIKGL